MRIPFIAVEEGKIIATVSLIKDSKMGLPADSFQSKIIQRLRGTGEFLAEVSALRSLRPIGGNAIWFFFSSNTYTSTAFIMSG